MYIQQFPNIDWLRRNASRNFSGRTDFKGNTLPSGWPNVVLNVKSTHTERDQIKGPFSLFFNLSGKSLVGLDKEWYQVSNSFYCLSNYGQTFNLHIPTDEITKTFNIHFGKSLYDEVTQLVTQKTDWALDNFTNSNVRNLEVLPKTEFMSEELRAKLLLLHKYGTQSKEDYSLDREYELTASILEHLILDAHTRLKKLKDIKALKASTRTELFRRVNVGLDFIHSNQLVNPDLDSISRHCGLSKFHFIRVFKEIYKQTPASYIANIKLKKAHEQIAQTDKELSHIATDLGFSELSAFTRFYKKATGQSPSSVRLSN